MTTADSRTAPDSSTGEPAPSLLVRSGNFFFRYRDAVSPAVFFALLLVTRPHLALGSSRADGALDALGFAVSAVGQFLRIAVVGYAYIIRGGKGRTVYAEDLVTGGLFATSRNPLYVGNLLIYFGLFLMWNSPWMYGIGVPFFLYLYSSIVAAEEAFLRRKFGAAYDRYCADVPRWVPDPRRLRAGLEGMQFNWKRVVLKEYGTVAAWLLTAALLVIAESVFFRGFAGAKPRIAVTVGCMVLVIAVWGTARWYKLSRHRRRPTGV